MKNVERRRGSHVRPRMSRKEFATFPTRDAFRPLVAFHTKIRILEIIRILLTCLSQLQSESVIHRTVLTPIHVLIGDEVCGRIDFRPWNLVDRKNLRNRPASRARAITSISPRAPSIVAPSSVTILTKVRPASRSIPA